MPKVHSVGIYTSISAEAINLMQEHFHVLILSLITCSMLALSTFSLLHKLVMFFFTWWGKYVFFFKDFVIDIVDSPKCRAACSAPIRVIVGKIFSTFWCQKLKEEFHTKRLTHCQKLAVIQRQNRSSKVERKVSRAIRLASKLSTWLYAFAYAIKK